MAKKDLKTIANGLFKVYPDENKVFVTTDGQGFFGENRAKNHAAKNKLEYQAFFREGHEIKDDTEIDDLLEAAEEKVQGFEKVLEKVQDIVNPEDEDEIEVLEDDHEAVKAVAELRVRFEASNSQLADASDDVKAYRELVGSLGTLIKGNETKLAKEIVKLLPVETEE